MKSEYRSLQLRILARIITAAIMAILAAIVLVRDTLLLVGFVVLIFAFLSFTTLKFVRYFYHISVGIDRLLDDSEQPIILKPELPVLQGKMNTTKTVIREQKKAAQESEQRKNDLVVYLAHDLKTPLTSVIGYLSLLQEEPEMPAEQKARYTEATLQKALRLEELINEFFDITRFNLQNIQLKERRIKLALMLEQIVDEFYPVLTAREMQAIVSIDPTIEIDGDASKLARVFSNLLKNAAVYGYAHSPIEIVVLKQEQQLTITFKNKGPTISAQQMEYIFEKFYRLDAAHSSYAGGAGLGLAIAQKIVEAHGGTIIAHSNNECTEFCVTLPSTLSPLASNV